MPEKIAFEWEASSQFRADSKAGEIVFMGFAVCNNGIVALAHRVEDATDWHYLSREKAAETGEIAHTVGCCRHASFD